MDNSVLYMRQHYTVLHITACIILIHCLYYWLH